MSFFASFLSIVGLFLAIGYLLPVIVCAVLVWRFGERSHWKLIPLITIVAVLVDFAHTFVIAYLDTIHELLQRTP